MRAIEIFLAPPAPRRGLSHPNGLRSASGDASAAIDVFVHGANVTARVGEGHGATVLRDLASAVVELAGASRGKAIVRFYDEPWELCIERLGGQASLSVYRTGALPEIAVYDARVPFPDVVGAAQEAVAGALERPLALHDRAALEASSGALAAIDVEDDEVAPDSELCPVSLELDADAPLSFAADFAVRAAPDVQGEPIERADLHGLLFRGRMRALVRGRVVELGSGHPFLFAESLLAVMRQALGAWEHGRTLHVRKDAGGAGVGVRLNVAGEVALSLWPRGPEREPCTFPALRVVDATIAAIGFGRSLVRAVLRRDRSQAHNLRLSAFRRELRETSDQVRDACRADSKQNPQPEPYRAFVHTARPPRVQAAPSSGSARLRYAMRWRALVPGIDLRSTFLCGDRMIVGGSHETFCLDRATGDVMWRVPTRRASSVATPAGIARLHADGELALHDYATGEIVVRGRVRPRTGGPPAGAVVSAPGLPRMVILAEGERHLSAVDLATGDARWRTAWGKGGMLRLKRHGKLLYFTSGDSAFGAIDVLTGAVVWRVRDRLRFSGAVAVDHDALFTVAGGLGGATQLYGVDPYSGAVRFATDVPGPDSRGDLRADKGAACTVEGAPLVLGRAVVIVVRDRQGVRLCAFERDTGALRWASPHTVAPMGTSWLAIDDRIVGNTPTGELVALDGETGALCYRHVLGRVLEADVPRRLEPVLRSGAVYVPSTDVHVFRPRDGQKLATVGPCEAIPDMLRVDERCNVYVAEESGHMACFGAVSRLELVR